MALDWLGLAWIGKDWQRFIEKLTLDWHQIGTGLVLDWLELAKNGSDDSGLGQGMALDWHLIGPGLESDWHWIGMGLALVG